VVPPRRRIQYRSIFEAAKGSRMFSTARSRSAAGGRETCVGRERRTHGRTANTVSALSRISASSVLDALGGLNRGRRMLDLRTIFSSGATTQDQAREQ